MGKPLHSIGAIRSPEKYLEAAQRRRTERFNHCFPRGISFGDIDSFVELGGRFLIIEWKLLEQTISTGQGCALARLASQANFTVWVVWTTEDGEITHGRNMAGGQRVPLTEERVCEAIRKWVASAQEAA